MGTLMVFLAWLLSCVVIDKILEAKKRKKQLKKKELQERIYRCKRINVSEFSNKKSA